jgi:hypothetical protein
MIKLLLISHVISPHFLCMYSRHNHSVLLVLLISSGMKTKRLWSLEAVSGTRYGATASFINNRWFYCVCRQGACSGCFHSNKVQTPDVRNSQMTSRVLLQVDTLMSKFRQPELDTCLALKINIRHATKYEHVSTPLNTNTSARRQTRTRQHATKYEHVSTPLNTNTSARH